MRKKHVEICLRHAQNEVLGGRRELRVRLLDLRQRLFVDDRAFPTVERLSELTAIRQWS